MSVEDYGQALGLTALVADALLSERVCGYMQQALESLLSALENAPETPIEKLEIIPPEERSRVLERFYRPPATTGTGSGLGLAIASEIAKRHDASLHISGGADGRGTVVTITFNATATSQRHRERGTAALDAAAE